jgi:nitrite reductase (NADH) large subunit
MSILLSLGGMSAQQREPSQTICFCHNVTYGELLKAISEGATTAMAIQAETCASTGCGGCETEVGEILQEELEKVELEKAELAKVAAK